MVFIPREPVLQDQFCLHDSTGSAAAAGDVVYLSGDQTVVPVSGSGNEPFGFLLQTVKAEMTGLPAGYRMASDLGSSDAFIGDPVGVAHLGIYDTTTYVLDANKTTFTAGEKLYADITTAHLVNGTTGTVAGVGSPAIAIAMNSLSAAAVTAGSLLRVKLLI
jgi:hypothetical protein